MKDLSKMTDYERERQFPPSKIGRWVIRGAVYLGLAGFGWALFYLIVVLVMAAICSRFVVGA